MRTEVLIIGAGPAGLLLGALLDRHGIDTMILERRDRTHVESRIRAGILEQGTQELMREAGVSGRMDREGLVHEGIELALDGRLMRVDLAAETGGRSVMVYGQTQVVQDLVAARLAAGRPLVFEAQDVALSGLEGDRPSARYHKDGEVHDVECSVVVGCDGFHGVARRSIPEGVLSVFERTYPFAWLGILARCPPPAEELIYARHHRGFGLFSMRAPTIARHYIQCDPHEDLAEWPDERVWDELEARLGGAVALPRGEVTDKSVTPMRSFVAEPMRYGRLFLAGDAAHIVPPTGAKGLNLAASDVHYLAEALVDFFRTGAETGIDGYSERALARVWKAQRFSWWMTSMLHNFGADEGFANRLHRAELDYVLSSPAARTSLAENYVGLPY